MAGQKGGKASKGSSNNSEVPSQQGRDAYDWEAGLVPNANRPGQMPGVNLPASLNLGNNPAMALQGRSSTTSGATGVSPATDHSHPNSYAATQLFLARFAAEGADTSSASTSQVRQAEGLVPMRPPQGHVVANMTQRTGVVTPSTAFAPATAPPFGVIGNSRPPRAPAQIPAGQQQLSGGWNLQTPTPAGLNGAVISSTASAPAPAPPFGIIGDGRPPRPPAQTPNGQQQPPGGWNLQPPNPAGLGELVQDSTPISNGGPGPNTTSAMSRQQWAAHADQRALQSNQLFSREDPRADTYRSYVQHRDWKTQYRRYRPKSGFRRDSPCYYLKRPKGYTRCLWAQRIPPLPRLDPVVPVLQPAPDANGQPQLRNGGMSTSQLAGEDPVSLQFLTRDVFGPSDDEEPGDDEEL